LETVESQRVVPAVVGGWEGWFEWHWDWGQWCKCCLYMGINRCNSAWTTAAHLLSK
jgi:hypothetical protein